MIVLKITVLNNYNLSTHKSLGHRSLTRPRLKKRPCHHSNNIVHTTSEQWQLTTGLFYYSSCTYRPGEVKRDDDLSHIARFAGVVLCSLKRKYISTENVSRSRAKGARPSGGDFRLVLLQAHFKVSIALVPYAALVLRVPRAVATFPVPQLTVDIFYSNQLQLKIARGLGYLK